jgi:hypothetical protein
MNDGGNPYEKQPSGNDIASANTTQNSSSPHPATEQQLQTTEQKIEERMSAFERSIVRLTWAAVVISILTAFIFAGQLYEMISGGTQTDKLISYAKTQANASSNQADAAQQFSDTAEDINGGIADAVGKLQTQANQTETLAKNALSQAKATNDLAGAASRSAFVSEAANKQGVDLFKLQNRPWVGVNGEVTFDENRSPKWVAAKLKNFGNQPALNTNVSIYVLTMKTYGIEEVAKVAATIDEECRIGEGRVSPGKAGDLLLPGVEEPWSAGIDRPDLSGVKTSLIMPGCIVYKDTDGVVHRTRFCYMIGLSSSPTEKTFGTCWGQSAD